MMISHQRMGDNGNGPDRVIEYILTHKLHKRHRYHQYRQWLSKSCVQYLMKTLVAPEDDTDPDRENEHLYMYRKIPMMSQQLWNHKVARVTVQGCHKEKKVHKDLQDQCHLSKSRSTSSSHGPSTSTTSTSTSTEDGSADNDDDHGEGESGPAIQSARSHDSRRTVLFQTFTF